MAPLLSLRVHFIIVLFSKLSSCGLVFLEPPGVPDLLDTNSSSRWETFSSQVAPRVSYMNASIAPQEVMHPERRRNENWYMANNERFLSLVGFP
jgi:hypothetical protein